MDNTLAISSLEKFCLTSRFSQLVSVGMTCLSEARFFYSGTTSLSWDPFWSTSRIFVFVSLVWTPGKVSPCSGEASVVLECFFWLDGKKVASSALGLARTCARAAMASCESPSPCYNWPGAVAGCQCHWCCCSCRPGGSACTQPAPPSHQQRRVWSHPTPSTGAFYSTLCLSRVGWCCCQCSLLFHLHLYWHYHPYLACLGSKSNKLRIWNKFTRVMMLFEHCLNAAIHFFCSKHYLKFWTYYFIQHKRDYLGRLTG